MDSELRSLIAQHGVKEVYDGLQRIMKEDYEALKAIFNSSNDPKEKEEKVKKPVVVAKTKPIEEATNDTIASLVQKSSKGGAILIQKIQTPPAIEDEAPKLLSELVEPIIQQTAKPTFSTLKEAKQWQKAQEEAKHKALVAQGINPLTLLTKENLTKWIQEERKPYSVIARELVGLPELQVASTAKEFGIKPVIGRPHKTKKSE